jgi:ABC-2 type transport system ATP-binding protein
MKQRLGIAQALLSRPALLICDEPTSALDPVGRKEILDILMKIKGSTTVIFSTHILSDVERICDRVAVLHGGGVAVNGTLSEIRALHGRDSLLLQFSRNDEVERFISCETIAPLLSNAEINETEVVLHGADMGYIQRNVISALARIGLCPSKMELMEPTLENLFLEVVQ